MAKDKIPLLNGFTREYLASLFHCDPEKGILIRKVFKSSKALVGSEAGFAGKNARHLRVRVDRKRLSVHKIIYFLETGESPAVLDHINRNGFDNRLINLREATLAQNCYNKSTSKVNTTGFKGVTYRHKVGNFEAAIKVQGRTVYLGVFASASQAAQAYNNAAVKYFREFAHLNVL